MGNLNENVASPADGVLGNASRLIPPGGSRPTDGTLHALCKQSANNYDTAFELVATPSSVAAQIAAAFGNTVNRLPVLVADTSTINDTSGGTSGNLLSNDTDADGDTLTVTGYSYGATSFTLAIPQLSTYGTIFVGSNGAWSFVPNALAQALDVGQTAIEVFTYTVSDGRGGVAAKNLTVTILGTNGPPSVTGQNKSAPMNTAITGNLMDTASDPEGQAIRVSQFVVAGDATVHTIANTGGASTTATISGVGSITIARAGTFTFTPDTDWSGAVPTITYTITDGSGDTDGALLMAIVPPVLAGYPRVLDIDCPTGFLTGGQNNKGCYLRIYGRNFGASGLGTTTKVYIGGVEVDNYRFMRASPSHPKTAVQEIGVQVGALGGATLGLPIPVKVVVNGVESNTDITFTPCTGRALFVSTSGNDATAVIGDITHPYRYVQAVYDSSGNALSTFTGAYFNVQPGDHVYFLEGSWGDANGLDNTWMKACPGIYARNGTANAWVHFSAYPGAVGANDPDDVHYTTPAGKTGGFHGPNQSSAGSSGEYFSFSGFRMEVSGGSQRDAAPFNTQYLAGPWRVMGNEIGPWPVGSSPILNAAGVAGHGVANVVRFNYIHDIEGTSDLQNHGIYVDSKSINWDIGWNYIKNCTGGSLIQFNDNEGLAGSGAMPHGGVWLGFQGMRVHHNWLENAAKYGINYNDQNSLQLGQYDGKHWNNVIIGTKLPPIRINSTQPKQYLEFYYNTLYNCMQGPSGSGYSYCHNEGFGAPFSPGGEVHNRFYDNVFAFGANTIANCQWRGDIGPGGSVAVTNSTWDFKRNLYFANGQSPTAPSSIGDSSAVIGDPLFVNTSTLDLSLQSGSPAANAATQALPSPFTVDDDFRGTQRSGIGAYPDIGAYEYNDPNPYNTTPPTVSGGPQVGVATTVTSVGSWANSPGTFGYSHRMDGVEVSTSASYTPVAGDSTKTYTIIVSATNIVGTGTYTVSVGVVATGAGGPAFTVNPSVSPSSAVSGSVFTVTPGTVTGAGSPYTRQYQWQRLVSSTWTNIGGATSTTYTSGSSDIGASKLRCREIAVDGTNGNAVAYSSAVTVTTPPADPVVRVVSSTDQIASSATPSSFTATATLPNNVVTGNWLLVGFMCESAQGSSLSMSSARCATQSAGSAIGTGFSAGATDAGWFAAQVTSDGACTVSVSTNGNGNNISIVVIEIENTNGTTLFDISAANGYAASGTTCSTSDVTTATANDLALMVIGSWTTTNAGSITAGAGWTAIGSEAVGGDAGGGVYFGPRVRIQKRKVSTPATISPTATVPAGKSHASVVILKGQ